MKITVHPFFKGLLAAALGGAVSVIADPHAAVNDPKGTAKVAGVGALIAVLAYLKSSPIPATPASQVTHEAPTSPRASNAQETGN